MPRVYVEFAGLKEAGNDCKAVSVKIDSIQSDFQRTIRQLDWDVKYEADINNTANQIARKLERYSQTLKEYKNFIDNAYSEYQKLEKVTFDIKKIDISSIVRENSIETNSDSEEKSDNQLISFIKSILKWRDKTKTDEISGIGEDGISYLESLYKFFNGDMRGLTGAESWFDLCDKSVGLWTGLYDYLKDFYKEVGDIFSIENQTKIGGVGVVGSTLGFISSLFGAIDTIKNTEDIGVAGKFGQSLGVVDDVVDIWSDIIELKHIGDTATNITTKKGVYSPLMIYSTIIKGYLSTFSQGFTSYEKYSADGIWDLNDTSAVGIESSVSGLYSMISALTFGLVSEGTTGVSVNDVSNVLESGCCNIGSQAGEYILANPTLYQMYENSNAVGKVFITFYAAIKS